MPKYKIGENANSSNDPIPCPFDGCDRDFNNHLSKQVHMATSHPLP